MSQTETTLSNSLNVDISSEEELLRLKALKPVKKYRETRYSFVCAECGKIKTLMLCSIKAFPISCRGCRYRHKYDDPNYIEKMKQTNLERYGVEFNSQTKAWKESIKKTSMDKYGVHHFTAYKEISEKIKKTTIEKFGAIGFASEEIRNKQRDTMNAKYNGYHNLVVPELKERFFSKLSEKHGGIGNASTEIKEKFKSTMIEKYGTVNYTQTTEYSSKCKKKYLYDEIFFDSLNEIKYYIDLKSSGVEFTYHPKIKFTYMANDKIHHYFPDFIVNDEIIELKGRQFFINLESDDDIYKPNVHMINPYNRKYDDIADAKFACMKDHNVKIVIVSALKNPKGFIRNNNIIVHEHGKV